MTESLFSNTGRINIDLMQKYFNIFLEFNHEVLKCKIEEAIKSEGKGYVCVVDANVLTVAQKDEKFLNVINGSLVNTCDGSSIAMLASVLHQKQFRALNGPELFAYYIEQQFSQLLLGSNEATLNLVMDILKSKGIDKSHLSILPLPFNSAEDFNYLDIAAKINELKPQIIWVSLGAPKQELFMATLLPHIKSGVMFGIGAAFNFYIGTIALPNAKVGALKFIWVSRIFSEPMKQLPRILHYLKILPRLYWQEKGKLKHSQLKK